VISLRLLILLDEDGTPAFIEATPTGLNVLAKDIYSYELEEMEIELI
jgi:hypothetical protein